MTEINSHTHRYLLPWNWEHEKHTRSAAISETAFIPDYPNTLQPHWFRCDARHTWRVWTTSGTRPQNCDAGPCYTCDAWSTRKGDPVRWDEMSDCHLKNIVRLLIRNLSGRHSQQYLSVGSNRRGVIRRRKSLGFAVMECRYRGLLPTQEDLMVYWDRACELGHVNALGVCKDAPSFMELWVNYSSTH